MDKITTADVGKKFLAVLAEETDNAASTMTGIRSLRNRLGKFSPELPVSREAFEAYLGIPEGASFNVQLRRYDFANHLLKSDIVKELGIANICDEVARPRKTVRVALVAAPTEPERAEEGAIDTAKQVEDHLEILRKNDASVHTLTGYRAVFKRMIKAAPTLPMTVEQVYETLGDPDKPGSKPSTRRHRYAVMQGFFNGSTYEALKLAYPLKNVPRPRKGKVRKRTFTDDEIAALLATGDEQETLFVRVLLDTGIRVGEAVSMRAEYIDDDEMTVVGKKGVRSVPFSPPLAQEVKAQADAQGNIWYDEDGPLTVVQLRTRFRNNVERAGISKKPRGAHTLRKTFASRWALNGGSSPLLKEILGHADLATTEAYIDVVPAHVKHAHAQFSAAVTMGLVEGANLISRGRWQPC